MLYRTQKDEYEQKKSRAPPPVTNRTQPAGSRDAGGFGQRRGQPPYGGGYGRFASDRRWPTAQ